MTSSRPRRAGKKEAEKIKVQYQLKIEAIKKLLRKKRTPPRPCYQGGPTMSQQNSSLDLEAKLIERTMGQRDEMIAKADAESKTLIDNAEKEAQRLKSEADRQILNIVASVLRGVRDRIVGGVDRQPQQLGLARRRCSRYTVMPE
jgi:F0F1-type ATP synthase membrane subunit b/b'